MKHTAERQGPRATFDRARFRRGSRLAALLAAGGLAALTVVAGCEGEWEPTGIGPDVRGQGGDGDDEGDRQGALTEHGGRLIDDLVMFTDPEDAAGGADGVASETRALAADGQTTDGFDVLAAETPTKVFYLEYADGKSHPHPNPDPCPGTAPKFVCSFAPTLEECQRQIQAYLDKWYAEFNITFTMTRPTQGRYYTEVISSGGGKWCDADSRTAGVAPFNCRDLAGGTAYTLLGGESAEETAIIIAQEQAHLVGLEHTDSQRDIMNPTICRDCSGGFENVTNKVRDSRCNRSTQNSFAMMKERLGTWDGGVKPNVFGCRSDASSPSVSIKQPVNGATVPGNFRLKVQASDDCEVKSVKISVSPLGQSAEAKTAPYEWDLANIRGRQSITATATDRSGKTTSQTITVNAPGAATADGGATVGDDAGTVGLQDPGAAAAAGCAGSGCDVTGSLAPSAAALAAALAALAALLALRRRPAPARQRRPERTNGRAQR